MSENSSDRPRRQVFKVGTTQEDIMYALANSALSGVIIKGRTESDVLSMLDQLTFNGLHICSGIPVRGKVYVSRSPFNVGSQHNLLEAVKVASVIWLEVNPKITVNKMFLLP